jgi:hypothetical protein
LLAREFIDMSLEPSTTSRETKQSVTIPATLRSRSSIARNVPIVAGLCVPKGRLSDVADGCVSGFNRSVAAQFEVLNRWNDGSVRWMLTSFVAPETNSRDCEVSILASSETSRLPVLPSYNVTTVKGLCGEICVVTRDLSADPPRERILRLMPCFSGIDGTVLPLHVETIRKEIAGPIRQVFVVDAQIQSLHFVTLQLRLTHWVSAGFVQVETRIRNTRRAKHAGGLWDLGDAGSLRFGSLEIAIVSDEISANAITHWKAERSSTVHSTSTDVFLRQFSSGGKNWESPNHVAEFGKVELVACGYETKHDELLIAGERAEPTFLTEGDSSFLAVAIPEFWQHFPGSIAAAMGTLEVGLFPALPSMTYELQGGEQKTKSFWLATGSGSGDVHALDWVHDQPRLIQTPGSIAESNVLPWFSRSHPAQHFGEFMHDATSGKFSQDARRESIDEYGWRNFGDIPADHEQTHYAGSNTVVSHYNNQFDMIFGGVLQFAATGDLKWFDLLDPLARHVMDIDIYHTSEDRAAFNGGLFWHTDHYVDAHTCTHRTYSRRNQKRGQSYGGGPGCEHNYTTGLLHYYFLTGHEEARESVLSLADWVIQMDDGRNTVFGLLDNGPTGAASATVFEDFHGPGRGAGNSINALLDSWMLTRSEHYMSKLEELIRRCVHPSQNPDDLHLLDAEGHWSYTVFLNALGRYLLAKRDEDSFDAMYSYGREVLKTYGRWMAANERRTLDRPEELQYPTEAWAAQDFRKANVLRIAASCDDEPAHATAMRAKADEINDAAWNDLKTFGDARFNARCLSILMTEGHREVFHRTCEPLLIPACPIAGDFGQWSMFVPQKQRIKLLFKSPGRLIVAGIKAFHPYRIFSAWKAFRRILS